MLLHSAWACPEARPGRWLREAGPTAASFTRLLTAHVRLRTENPSSHPSPSFVGLEVAPRIHLPHSFLQLSSASADEFRDRQLQADRAAPLQEPPSHGRVLGHHCQVRAKPLLCNHHQQPQEPSGQPRGPTAVRAALDIYGSAATARRQATKLSSKRSLGSSRIKQGLRGLGGMVHAAMQHAPAA